ncbi:MAG: hypothetical protein WEC33_07175 [Dehalococcoidia bacterium]
MALVRGGNGAYRSDSKSSLHEDRNGYAKTIRAPLPTRECNAVVADRLQFGKERGCAVNRLGREDF